ncbi:MAG: hypothetical protein R6U00_05375 [Prochlorococcaceae cyanobacterium]
MTIGDDVPWRQVHRLRLEAEGVVGAMVDGGIGHGAFRKLQRFW